MDDVCEWIRYSDEYHWYTECGHNYNPYVKANDIYPPIKNDTCPYCGKKIEYNEEDGL